MLSSHDFTAIPSGKPTRSCTVQGSRNRSNVSWPDGTECIEEHDANSGLLLLRKWRRKTILGGLGPWIIEVGESTASTDIKISSSSPTLSRQDSLSHFIWRVRNAPWPLENYTLSVQDRLVIVKTINKKYYTRIAIPDLDRLGLPLESSSLSWQWGSNTLVISYRKPNALMQLETQERLERNNVSTSKKEEREDPQCKQS